MNPNAELELRSYLIKHVCKKCVALSELMIRSVRFLIKTNLPIL